MAYIIFVNPAILHETGMPLTAVVAATCLCAAFGSFLMGILARYPIALAPGMGLNAYFTYSVVKGLGVPWETALGAVFLSGVAFLILTAVGVRQMIVSAIPFELYAAVAVGIGLFIAFIGLHNSGIVVANKETLVSLGNLRNPDTLLAIFGLLLIASLMAWKVRGAILIGILGTTALGVVFGLVRWHPQSYSFQDITATAFHLNIRGALSYGLVEIVFVFLFVDLFDNIGTLVAVGKQARLFDRTNQIPRINRILFSDAAATIAGSLAGTSTVTSYIESAGWGSGGRPIGSDGHHNRDALLDRDVHRAGGGSDSGSGDSARADCGRFADDRSRSGDTVVEPGDLSSGFSHDCHHSAYFQHRQWPGLRVRRLYGVKDRAR